MARRGTPIAPAKRGVQQPAQLVAVRDLSGGVDLRHAPTLLAPERARVLRNWSLQEPGVLTTYPGWVQWTDDARYGPFQGAQRAYLSGVTVTVVAAEGSLWSLGDDGVWGQDIITPAYSGLAVTTAIEFPHDRDILAAFDGASAPVKSRDGETWTAMGLVAPTSAPTMAAAPGGSLVDGHEYEVSYSFRDDGLVYESNESPTATATVTLPNKQLVLTLSASSDTQVDTLCVYARDVTAGESVRRRVGTVAMASPTATYTISSNSWSAGVEALTDHDVAPVLSFGVVWKNRWWARSATVKNRIHFTQIFQSQAWPTLFYLDIPFTRGDEVRAMASLGDTLVIFGQTAVFLLVGQTSLDFEVRPAIGALAGALGPRAVCAIEQGIVHAANGGVYIFDGATDRLLSDDIAVAWNDVVSGSTSADLDRLAVVYHDPRKEIRVAVPRLYPLGTAGEWVLDLHRTRLQDAPAWTSTTRDVLGYISWDGAEATTGNRGRLFSYPRTSGVVNEEATGTTANGSELVADYEGPTLATGLPVARFLDLYGEYTPATGVFGVEVVVDGVPVMTETFTPGDGLAVYGTGTYGTATYGSQTRKPWTTMLPLEAEGRTVTLKAQYRGTQAFSLYSYALGVVPEAVPRGF